MHSRVIFLSAAFKDVLGEDSVYIASSCFMKQNYASFYFVIFQWFPCKAVLGIFATAWVPWSTALLQIGFVLSFIHELLKKLEEETQASCITDEWCQGFKPQTVLVAIVHLKH